MPEEKFGETPLIKKDLFAAICEEKKKEGFEYAGGERLTSFELQKDDIFEEVPIQTMPEIEERYKKLPGVKEVKLVLDPGDINLVWVFLKSK